MLDMRFRTITEWPGKPTMARRRDPFGADWAKLLVELKQELSHLKARDIIVETYHDAADIRNDGWPRSSAKEPSQPGVILTFVSKLGPLRYPCDTYNVWRGNLRAISLALKALRAVDRYGVTSRAEQYRGWSALPPPNGHAAGVSPQDAAKLLARLAGYDFADASALGRDDLNRVRKAAALRCHPDQGGTDTEWKALQEVEAILKGAHWL